MTRLPRSAALTGLVVLSCSLLLTLLSARGALAEDASVLADEATFQPSAVTIEPGESVFWTNVTEDTTHNLVGSDGWPTGDQLLAPGQTVVVQFAEAGSYSYYCDIHFGMFGTVEVAAVEPTESPSPTPSTTESVSPTPTDTPTFEPTTPSPSPSPTPTILPTFGGDAPPGEGPSAPELAASALTPPPDSPFKPPLTILSTLAVILLFAANPLTKPRPQPVRVPAPALPPRRRPEPPGPVRVTRN